MVKFNQKEDANIIQQKGRTTLFHLQEHVAEELEERLIKIGYLKRASRITIITVSFFPRY